MIYNLLAYQLTVLPTSYTWLLVQLMVCQVTKLSSTQHYLDNLKIPYSPRSMAKFNEKIYMWH